MLRVTRSRWLWRWPDDVPALIVHARYDEASLLSSELEGLLDSIGDPTLTLGLLYGALPAKYEHGELTEALRLAERMIELADGDAAKGNLIIGSPLTGAYMMRGCARCFLGAPGWQADVDRAVIMARTFDPAMRGIMLLFKYMLVPNGVFLPDATDLDETAELLEIAERSGDDLTLACARYVHGVALAAYDGPQRADASALFAAARAAALQERFTLLAATFVDLHFAKEKARAGDVDQAIDCLRHAVDAAYNFDTMILRASATASLVEALLRRGGSTDLGEAQATIDRLAALPTESGFVLNDLWLLSMRAAMARARGDVAAYGDYRDNIVRWRIPLASTDISPGRRRWSNPAPP